MSIRIVLDAMGSDSRPAPELEAAPRLIAKYPDLELLLVGNQADLEPKLKALGAEDPRIKVINATQALEMSDHIQEARAKKDNTMQVGMDLIKAGKADAFVTAGNTGMAMYFAMKTLGMIEGVARPCLVAVLPVEGGQCVVTDIGANAECRPEFLVQFGQMGSVYARQLFGLKEVKVGLIANGEEEGKGNELVKAAFPLMKAQVPGFVGNIEGKELFAGQVNVAVTDGFTGNVLLKSTEAVAKLILRNLKAGLMQSFFTKLGALLAKPAFMAVRKQLDPSEIGSAPLLGVNGLVFIGHGRSDGKAMVSAVERAINAVKSNLLAELSSSMKPENKEEKKA
ncbi:MAG TPA: phosphate acyltransferase PlsX [Anaerolineaceae bacterium]|nr:phosphate acyltransferase PlsX [Anaerolineaceae bacterium]